MLFVVLLATAGMAAGAAVAGPQITGPPSAAVVRKRADMTDSAYLSSASSLCAQNHWDCCPLTTGPLPVPTPDTASSFVANHSYSSLAAAATIPTGYSKAFTNAHGSIQQSFGYLGLTQLSAYDADLCADFCNQDSGCRAFNIYVERDPVLRPAYSVCTDPPSTGNIACTRWGYPINGSSATNDGSWQASFRVAITASNGYNKNLDALPPQTIPDFTGPTVINNRAIQDDSYYLFVDHSDQSAFDPALCAADCKQNTAYNKAHAVNGVYTACNTFNAYIPVKNGVAEGTRCVLYSEIVSDITNKATNTGETRGNDVYTIGESDVYTLTTPDNGQL
ncbi:hypothetical protein GTA08_BOTSDO13234 [Botryosphaeria dothidea]|uniref:Apple domain-containing protein n=1 Tax=Botryosphaeria dothidea TaxID=55169 RepID=A0A8H4J356_9PEZI|nr:hypothetical protein GTA08_BOTSDO13234 [Botryosphaeria dothidea]